MSRIKFRAWDKEEKKMIVSNFVIMPNGMVLDRYDLEYKVELMQSTGLFDKNGKMIFEGDVCKYSFGDEIATGEVVYFGAMFGINGLALNAMPKLSVEVIGNVYENENLLK